LGYIVNDLLAKYFPDIVDIKFTARMEEELDEIASDNRDWVNVARDFYKPFESKLKDASALIEKVKLADAPTDEVCPECGRPLVIKLGRFGKFVACSGYPECKFTKNFQIKTGAKCPECGSELVQKVSKKRRTFYSCSAYPKCRFATNLKPLPQPCPQCGSLLTEYKGKQAKCIKCDYRGKIEDLEAKSAGKN
jgi:DNA topoisomerase-1